MSRTLNEIIIPLIVSHQDYWFWLIQFMLLSFDCKTKAIISNNLWKLKKHVERYIWRHINFLWYHQHIVEYFKYCLYLEVLWCFYIWGTIFKFLQTFSFVIEISFVSFSEFQIIASFLFFVCLIEYQCSDYYDYCNYYHDYCNHFIITAVIITIVDTREELICLIWSKLFRLWSSLCTEKIS